MSEWLNYVKAYAEKNKITYKQALRDASPSYKTRNEKKPEEPKEPAATSGRLVGGSTSNEPKQEEPTKPKRKSNKKVVENITLKF
jgi:hypothetical protein